MIKMSPLSLILLSYSRIFRINEGQVYLIDASSEVKICIYVSCYFLLHLFMHVLDSSLIPDVTAEPQLNRKRFLKMYFSFRKHCS